MYKSSHAVCAPGGMPATHGPDYLSGAVRTCHAAFVRATVGGAHGRRVLRPETELLFHSDPDRGRRDFGNPFTEPPRVSGRLHHLREWSYGNPSKEVFT